MKYFLSYNIISGVLFFIIWTGHAVDPSKNVRFDNPQNLIEAWLAVTSCIATLLYIFSGCFILYHISRMWLAELAMHSTQVKVYDLTTLKI